MQTIFSMTENLNSCEKFLNFSNIYIKVEECADYYAFHGFDS